MSFAFAYLIFFFFFFHVVHNSFNNIEQFLLLLLLLFMGNLNAVSVKIIFLSGQKLLPPTECTWLYSPSFMRRHLVLLMTTISMKSHNLNLIG